MGYEVRKRNKDDTWSRDSFIGIRNICFAVGKYSVGKGRIVIDGKARILGAICIIPLQKELVLMS